MIFKQQLFTLYKACKRRTTQKYLKFQCAKNTGTIKSQATTKQAKILQKDSHTKERMLTPIMITIGESRLSCFNPQKII